MLGNIGRWDWYQTLPQYSEVAPHIEEIAPHIEEVAQHTDVPRKRISRPLRQWWELGNEWHLGGRAVTGCN